MEKNNKGSDQTARRASDTRPYDPRSTPVLAEIYVRDGHCTNEQLAAKFGVTPRTIYEWKKKHPAFLQAISTPNDLIDGRVEDNLLKLCYGFEVEETVIIASLEGKTKRVSKVTKHIPPSLGAIRMWLTNRKPAQWREKPPEAEPGQSAGSNVDDIIAALVKNNPIIWSDEEPDEEPEIDMDPGIDIED